MKALKLIVVTLLLVVTACNGTPNESDPTPTPTQDSEEYLNRGNKRFKQEDYKGAIDDYTEAIENNPNNATAYYNRAGARFELKDYEGAIDDYTKVIKLNPNDAEARANLRIARKLDEDQEVRLPTKCPIKPC